jgi:hypothetical protein
METTDPHLHPTRRAFLQRGVASAFLLGTGLWRAPVEAAAVARSSPGGGGAADVDVLIFDSTPAGIVAAIAVARSGYRPLIVTEDRHVGGMQTSGLGWTNAGQRETVGGIAREFYDRVHRHYLARHGPSSPQAVASQDGFRFEPHVAERVYLDWMREAGVECWTEEGIAALEKDGPRIRSVRLRSGRVVRARTHLDASYEGDLLKLAGCSYHLGRESARTYGESLAGIRFPPRHLGEGDRRLQSFDFRLCLTDVPANQAPFREPESYDPSRYDYERLLIRARSIVSLPHTDLMSLNPLPNRKTDSRTVKLYGGSWNWPEATLPERQRIAGLHREHAEGFIWFLLTHPSIPAPMREEMARWGYAADEFADNGHWPYHLYIREARRLIGEYVMAQRDVTEERFKPDAVALGSFFLDVHPVRILAGTAAELWKDGNAKVPEDPPIHGMVAEGGLGKQPVKPYEIPYRVLLPKRGEVENLLVPICVSASHVAFSTLRMEPVYQQLGHVGGLAAALSLRHDVPVQAVDAKELRERLVEQGQILDARPFMEEWPFSSSATGIWK